MQRTFWMIFLFVVFQSNIYSSQHVPSNEEMFNNKTIVIFGGAGYLGKAIATAVLKHDPKKVIIFSRDEVKHYFLEKGFDNHPKIKSVLGDIRDYEAVKLVSKNADIVFHAAALKRMDALELNPHESIKTNIIASMNVFSACVENEVDKVLYVSTDKACLPINIYGSSKFTSEKIFTNYDHTIKTKFVVTRFGNIFDSTGSVVPFFVRKIEHNEDLTLTDDRMTRFVISKEEASDIILDAIRYTAGGEIFIKNLRSFKVTDLIDVLKSYFKVNNRVLNIGLRPGEKLHEDLISKYEMARSYSFQDYYVVCPSIDNHDYTTNGVPEYIQSGTRINSDQAFTFSSDQALMTQEELADYFVKTYFNGE